MEPSEASPVEPGGTERIRLRIDLAYDGTDFSGWAVQPGLRTVEGTLSEALTTMLRSTEPVRITVAGRTDAGVHASGQVAHVDVDLEAYAALPGRSARSPGEAAVTRLRGILPPDVVVRSVSRAAAGFDARFSALRRRYRYLLCDEPSALDPLRRNAVVVTRHHLDEAAMDRAAQHLVGLHDFAAFCRKREGATTIRTLLEHRWARNATHLVEGTVVADAFCHSMVRALVGAMVAVGEGRFAETEPAAILAAGERDPRVIVMPPHGLSLEDVVYPTNDELAERAVQARARRELPEAVGRA